MPLLAIPHPNLDPVILPIYGALAIRWYGFSYFLGFVCGYFVLRSLARSKRLPMDPRAVGDLVFATVLGVVIGGRLGYVLFYKPASYFADPLSIFRLQDGGMSFHGGLIGVVTSLPLYARRHRIPFVRLADAAAFATPAGLFFGRLANFINKELVGRPSDWAFAVDFGLPEAGGASIPRHASQIYEALTEGVMLFFALAFLARRSERPGVLAVTFLLGYSMCRFAVEFTREPDSHLGLTLGLSRGQYLCLAMMLVGTITLVRLLRRPPEAMELSGPSRFNGRSSAERTVHSPETPRR